MLKFLAIVSNKQTIPETSISKKKYKHLLAITYVLVRQFKCDNNFWLHTILFLQPHVLVLNVSTILPLAVIDYYILNF